jgi:hypothetical protein
MSKLYEMGKFAALKQAGLPAELLHGALRGGAMGAVGGGTVGAIAAPEGHKMEGAGRGALAGGALGAVGGGLHGGLSSEARGLRSQAFHHPDLFNGSAEVADLQSRARSMHNLADTSAAVLGGGALGASALAGQNQPSVLDQLKAKLGIG